jgi:outer membrane protein TolC
MSKSSTLLLAAACLLLPLPRGAAQQDSARRAATSPARTLTLDESLALAFERSYIARNARAQLQSSEASARAARLALFSTVDLSFDLPNYSFALAQEFNSVTNRKDFFQTENLQWSGALNINQPLLWTNGTLTLSGLLYRIDQRTEVGGHSFTRDFFTNVAFTFKQPLFVTNAQRNALRRAEIAYEEALAEFRAGTLDVSYEVTSAFYRSYSTQEQLTIQADRVRQQEEAYATAQRRYKAGLIAEVDALQFEVDLAAARSDLLAAANTFTSQANAFKVLIGLSIGDSIRLQLSDTTFHPVAVDDAEAVAMAKRTRVDLQRARNNVERGELALREARSARTVRADLELSYGINNRDEELQKLFMNPLDARGVRFTVSVPVFDWGRHARQVEAAEADLLSASLTADNTALTIEQEVSDLVRRTRSAAERVAVLFKSRIVAEKANEITTKRYDVGTVTSVDLQQSQSRLLQARLSALSALIDYNVALADLTRRTAHDFVRGVDVGVDGR